MEEQGPQTCPHGQRRQEEREPSPHLHLGDQPTSPQTKTSGGGSVIMCDGRIPPWPPSSPPLVSTPPPSQPNTNPGVSVKGFCRCELSATSVDLKMGKII